MTTENRNETARCLTEINEMIMRFKMINTFDPKFMVLPSEHRIALRILCSQSMGLEIWDVSEPVEYLGIPIIKKEEAVIID